ncbi:uncharacterized protein [Dendrobates tinctorius]|uniref:uncharacterized protein n=1 Tax=Dendrobates tinctorius TaxID=92724 RepID=UPI003CCA0C47
MPDPFFGSNKSCLGNRPCDFHESLGNLNLIDEPNFFNVDLAKVNKFGLEIFPTGSPTMVIMKWNDKVRILGKLTAKRFQSQSQTKQNAIEDKWYNESTDLWQNESDTINFHGDQQDGDSFNSKSASETFRPALDKVNPTIEKAPRTKRDKRFIGNIIVELSFGGDCCATWPLDVSIKDHLAIKRSSWKIYTFLSGHIGCEFATGENIRRYERAMKIEGKSVLFIVLGVSLLVAVAEWRRRLWLSQDPEKPDFTKQVENKVDEPKIYLESTDQNEQNIQEDEPDLEKEYILVSKDKTNEKKGNQVPHVQKYSIIFPSKERHFSTKEKIKDQKRSIYKNSLSDSLYVFEMSKTFEGSGEVEPSPTPEGSGDIETSPTDVPEISTTIEGSGDIETPTTPEGSQDTKTTPTDLTEISTTLEGSGDIETPTTPEGSEDTGTTPTDVPEISTTIEGSGDTDTSPTPEGSEDTETTPTDIPEISTTLEETGDTEATFTSVTEVITTSSTVTEISTTTLEGPGDIETPTTPEGSEDTGTTPTDVPEISTTIEGSGDINTSPTPEGSEDTETTPTDIPGSGDIETPTTPEGSEDTETTPTDIPEISTTLEETGDTEATFTSVTEVITTSSTVTEISTTLEGPGDIETPTTPKVSGGTETTPTALPEIFTTPEDSGETSAPDVSTTSDGNIETAVSSVTEIFTTPEASVSEEATPTGLPVTYTTPESSVDATKTTPTTIPEGTGDVETTPTSVTDISATPVSIETRSPSTNIIYTTILITGTSHEDSGVTDTTVSGDMETSPLPVTDASTGKKSTADVSGKSSTAQITTKLSLSTPYVTISKESLMTTRGSKETLSTAGSLFTKPPNSTILESSKPSTSASLTTVFRTTKAKTTTRIPITTKITTKPNIPTIQPCHNGGTYDGIKCICLDNFYGPFCENVIDRVVIGPSVTTTINVFLRFADLKFDKNFENDESAEYKKFEMDFKKDMKVVYKDVPGYKDVKILSISEGSVNVDYDVIIEIEYKSDINVTQQYNNVVKDVEKGLSSILCNSSRDMPISNCISDGFQITKTENLKTEEELCLSNISAGFRDFYEPIVVEAGLVCVSHCDAISRSYTNCQDGSCQILNNTGPHCLCPKTDLYIYSSPNCNGKILKSGVYGGIGAAIAVLLIIICVVVVCFIREKRVKTWDPFANDEEKDWYDEEEEDWSVGINNLVQDVDYVDQDSSKDSFSSKREKFKPNLEAIDTTHEVKIQRPQVSLS